MARIRGASIAAVVTAAITVVVGFGGTSAAAQLDRVDVIDGGADGIQAEVTPALPVPLPVPVPAPPIVIPPTPSVSLPAGGGSVSDSAVDVGQPGVVEAGALNAQTNGAGVGTADGFVESSASAAGIDVGGGTIDADVISSQCRADADGSSGASDVVNGSVGGTDLPHTSPPPNTGGAIPGVGSLVLNAQDSQNTANSSSNDVTAVEAIIDTPILQGGVSIAESRCSAAGVSLDQSSVPPGDAPGPGAPNDDPDRTTGLLPRTGPAAMGSLLAVAAVLFATGTALRRIGRDRTTIAA